MNFSKHTFWLLVGLFISQNHFGQNSKDNPFSINSSREGFASIYNELHKDNHVGYRFFEHSPMVYGEVPLSEDEANIDLESSKILIDSIKNSDGVFIHKEEIQRNDEWSRQDWTYYMLPVEDGIEILLEVKTYGEGLPAYYGVQQCFRMSGKTNIEWRRTVAETPAFSEYDLWKGGQNDKSLTYMMQDDAWEMIPASENTLGARTAVGMAIDHLRSQGNLPEKVGPYEAEMLNAVGSGLIARTDAKSQWVCGIYWENTSHVTDHHPADCLHSIINIGNIPPYSSRVVRGKIYWFKGSLSDLSVHYQRDFVESRSGKLTIASCQFPVSGNIDENTNYIQQQMREAKLRNAEIVHFPECALSGYGGADFDDYENFDWDKLKSRTQEICDLAKELKLWVLLGSTHPLSERNKPHNSLYVINPDGKVIDRYDKRFCTSGDLDYYSPGDHFVNFEINDINCGLLICYDARFPELYREYRKLDTDIIFQSFYNARHGKDCIHPKIMPVTAQVRAATNSFYMSLTNSSAPFSWPCYFITPDGLVEKKLPANQPGILISEIDISKKYYDASGKYRMEAINGKLNSGQVVTDPKSKDRTSF
jgi:predicted amidohydrolase